MVDYSTIRHATNSNLSGYLLNRPCSSHNKLKVTASRQEMQVLGNKTTVMHMQSIMHAQSQNMRRLTLSMLRKHSAED